MIMNETPLEQLAKLLNDCLMNTDRPDLKARLDDINSALHNAARLDSGIRADELADPNREQDPIVRLFWVTLAHLTTKMYMEAGNQLMMSGELELHV